jgi:hypothetical protein
MNPMMQMLLTHGHVPGVPAYGHMHRGFWHPGSEDRCPKCPQPDERNKPQR